MKKLLSVKLNTALKYLKFVKDYRTNYLHVDDIKEVEKADTAISFLKNLISDSDYIPEVMLEDSQHELESILESLPDKNEAFSMLAIISLEEFAVHWVKIFINKPKFYSLRKFFK